MGFKETVKDWSVSGGCNYKCSPADRCCCGVSFSFFMTATGSGSGPGCKVDQNSPKIDGPKF